MTSTTPYAPYVHHSLSRACPVAIGQIYRAARSLQNQRGDPALLQERLIREKARFAVVDVCQCPEFDTWKAKLRRVLKNGELGAELGRWYGASALLCGFDLDGVV